MESVQETGIRICSIVRAMGPKNQALWKELGVGKVNKSEIHCTSFKNPKYDSSIFIFPDFPHLLKLLRNHLIDSKLTLPDGVVVDKSVIEDLLDVQRRDLKLAFKITHKHVNVRGKQRMKVRPAFELFSAKVAKAIQVAFPERKSEAEFFQLVNDFSDLMNSRTTPQPVSSIYKSAYGSKHQEQQKFLGKFYWYFSKIRVGRRISGSYAPFQKGFLIALRSLLGLFEEMTSQVSVKYIMTSRLNQNYVENSFGIVHWRWAKFEEYFEIFHPNGTVNQDFDIVKRLGNFLVTNFPAIPEKAIHLYAKTRTMIRISALNNAAESRKFIFQENRRNYNNRLDTENQEHNGDISESEDDADEELQNEEGEQTVEELLAFLDLDV